MDNAPPPMTPENEENIVKDVGNKRNKRIYFYLACIAVIILSYIFYNVLYTNKDNNENKGNKEKIGYEEPKKSEEVKSQFISGNFSLKIQKEEQDILKKNFMKYLELSRIIDSIENETIKQTINLWRNISYPYFGIDRFSIPMESTISAGKTSILNYLLNLKNNLLQIGENITTKFCVIIRDNKKYKKGKIFNVTIEKRAEINKYNFMKADEIKEDPKEFVRKRNNYIAELQKQKKEVKDPSLYFIILEIDTGLFEGVFEKYSYLVEFIDIPGLNEIGGENSFYFKNVLPFIKPNILFPLIILNADKYESTDTFEVLNELFRPYKSKYLVNATLDKKTRYDYENQGDFLKMVKNNSIFLINKINLFQKKERNKIINTIIQETSDELNVDIKIDSNCFIINAKAKNLEVNKYDSFLNYTNYTINNGDFEEDTEVFDIIANEFKKDFNFTIPDNIAQISEKSKFSYGYEEFYRLIHSHKLLLGKSEKSRNYYYYFSEQFENLKKSNILKFDPDGIQLKNAIRDKIKYSINKFLDKTIFNKILKYLEIEEKGLNEDFTQYIYIKEPLEVIKLLNDPVKELKKIGGNNEGINKLNDNYDDLIKFMQNNRFMHFLISGPYSSGKSFLLNNIIGNNLYLLQIGRHETTNHAFIVRNNNTDIKLYEANLKKNKYEYFFEKGKILASGKKVIAKIEDINNNLKEFSYFILETPIQLFKDINIKEEIINSIELIDYPGLNTKKAKKGNYTKKELFDIVNGFFFLNEPKDQGENGVKDVFKKIIDKFIYGDSNVEDLENCLFLFTKNNDNEQYNFNDLDIKEIILSLIESLKIDMDMIDIDTLEKKLNDSSIKYAKFSNIDYKKYVDMADKLDSFKKFISYIIKAKIDKIKKNNLKSLFENMDSYIKEKFEFESQEEEEKTNILVSGVQKLFNFITNYKNEADKRFKNYILNNTNSYITEFQEVLLDYKIIEHNHFLNINDKNKIAIYGKKYNLLKDNLKNSEYYKNSFYDDFKTKFNEIMNYSDIKIKKRFNKYLNQIVDETNAVFQTINSKFNMNQTEFKKIYSENVKENLINNIANKFNAFFK